MTATALDLSNSLASAIASASPSIVHVSARDHLASTGVVWSADGLIVTAAHTVRRDDAIEVRFDDASTAPATLVGRDESSDIAVLRVDRKNLSAARWRDTTGLRVGHIVIAAGRPGRTVRATSGIVSAIGPEWRTPGGTRIDGYVDVDASLPPGFSGGPLIDSDGAFIGLNTSQLIRRTGATIPHATLARIVDLIVKHGTVARPTLGIGIYPVEAGLLVISVQSGSAAERAGILVGDIIKMHHRELRNRIRDWQPETKFELTISRGGEEKRVSV
jgi:S1-C subfamily serine protease